MITVVVEVTTGTPFVFTPDSEAEGIAMARRHAYNSIAKRATVYVSHGNPYTSMDRMFPAEIFTVDGPAATL